MEKVERIIQHQETASWCGPACLSEAYNILTGKTISQEYCAQILGATDDDGVDFKKLRDGASQLELEAAVIQGVPLSVLKEYKSKGYVVIINWMSGRNFDEDGHYSLFEDVNSDFITLNDPEGLVGSLRIIRKSDFDKVWFDIDEGKRTERVAIVIKGELPDSPEDVHGEVEIETEEDNSPDDPFDKCSVCGSTKEDGKCPKCKVLQEAV